jgi:hypothetical protein
MSNKATPLPAIHDHANAYRHPHRGMFGRIVEQLANSTTVARMRYAVMSRLPFVKLESEVADVVYLTWLVPVSACASFVPKGVRLWQKNGLTPFTVLTYRHGHFGPSALGILRKLFPSPLQSNWRLYLEQAPAGAPPVRTVLFLKNVMNSLVYALGTRLFSDALPTHLAADFVHRRDGLATHTEIAAGAGSAPSLLCSLRLGCMPALRTDFASMFGSWAGAVEFLSCQDGAVAQVGRVDRLAFAEIELPIDLATALPAEPSDGLPTCSLHGTLRPVGEPLCFVVPRVRFRAVSERLL